MNKIKFGRLTVCLAVLAFLTIFYNNGFAQPPKRLFIVHSYQENQVCGQPQHDGAVKALTEAGWIDGQNLTVAVYYMETKSKNNTAALIAKQGKLALAKIKNFQPDVILTIDDNAFKAIALPLAGKPVQIVFSGVNGQPEAYNQKQAFMANRTNPGGNITGIYEKLHIREAIQVLSNLIKLKKIRFLDDLSPTGKAIARQVDLELQPAVDQKPLPCAVDRLTLKSWEHFRREIDEINKNPDIDAFYPGALLLKDASGKPYTASEIIDYLVKNARKPAIAPNYAFIKKGLYGGASIDFFAMGHQAGKKITAILDGARAGDLPISDAQRVALVFNISRAKTLGLTIPHDILMAADEIFTQ